MFVFYLSKTESKYYRYHLLLSDVWGPFLVITPASTLHNWQQEVAKFIPAFKVVPYWGSPQERKILRQFWDQTNMHKKSSTFHVVITSYQVSTSLNTVWKLFFCLSDFAWNQFWPRNLKKYSYVVNTGFDIRNHQNWFHVKSDKKKNLWISTLCANFNSLDNL